MKKKIFAVLLASATVFSLLGCHSESTTTTTFTTSYTDENGETTTHTQTTTTGNGETVTEEETTTSAEENSADIVSDPSNADAYETAESDIPTLRDRWSSYFEYGAEGTTNEGEDILFTYDDPDFSQAALMILNKDGVLTIYDIGPVRYDEESYVIEDVDGDVELPFGISETYDDHFVMTFQDGSYAELYYVDKDKILNDMVSIIEQLQEQNQ